MVPFPSEKKTTRYLEFTFNAHWGLLPLTAGASRRLHRDCHHHHHHHHQLFCAPLVRHVCCCCCCCCHHCRRRRRPRRCCCRRSSAIAAQSRTPRRATERCRMSDCRPVAVRWFRRRPVAVASPATATAGPAVPHQCPMAMMATSLMKRTTTTTTSTMRTRTCSRQTKQHHHHRHRDALTLRISAAAAAVAAAQWRVVAVLAMWRSPTTPACR